MFATVQHDAMGWIWPAAGRVQTILIMRLTGVACLFTMGLHPALWRVTWFIVPIVLLRSGAPAAPSPSPKPSLLLQVGMYNRPGVIEVQSAGDVLTCRKCRCRCKQLDLCPHEERAHGLCAKGEWSLLGLMTVLGT